MPTLCAPTYVYACACATWLQPAACDSGAAALDQIPQIPPGAKVFSIILTLVSIFLL